MPLQENRLILSRYLICLGTCFNILEPKSVYFYLPLTIFVLLELWRKVSIQNKQWNKRFALSHSCLPVQEDWHLVLSFTHFAANPAIASSWSASIEISSSFFVFRPAWEEIWGFRCHRYKYRYMQTCFRIGVLLLAVGWSHYTRCRSCFQFRNWQRFGFFRRSVGSVSVWYLADALSWQIRNKSALRAEWGFVNEDFQILCLSLFKKKAILSWGR